MKKFIILSKPVDIKPFLLILENMKLFTLKYIKQKFNKAKSVNPQSNIWNDVILKKIKKFSFKVKKL